jgi:hypothetical protein
MEQLAAGQGAGVVGAEDAFVVGEGLPLQVDSIIDLPCIAVERGKIVAAVQSAGVVGAEDAFAVGEGLPLQVDSITEPPHMAVVVGKIVAAVRPSTRPAPRWRPRPGTASWTGGGNCTTWPLPRPRSVPDGER